MSFPVAKKTVLFGVSGQTLSWRAPEGRADSIAGVTVFGWGDSDDGSAEPATTGSPSLASVDTTLDAASGASQADRRRINLTSTTNVEVGRQYLVTSPNGHREWIEVVEIEAGDYVVARYDLARDYIAASKFQSTEMQISLDDTWVADDTNLAAPWRPYRVRWEYVVDGVTYVHDDYFRISRYTRSHGVTAADMHATYPAWSRYMVDGHDDDRGEQLIEEGFEEVASDLRHLGIAIEQVRDHGALDELVRKRAAVALEDARLVEIGGDRSTLDRALERYNKRLDDTAKLISRLQVDTDESGSADTVQVARSLTEM